MQGLNTFSGVFKTCFCDKKLQIPLPLIIKMHCNFFKRILRNNLFVCKAPPDLSKQIVNEVPSTGVNSDSGVNSDTWQFFKYLPTDNDNRVGPWLNIKSNNSPWLIIKIRLDYCCPLEDIWIIATCPNSPRCPNSPQLTVYLTNS